VAEEIAVGARPVSLAASVDAERVFVLCRDDGLLHVLDAETGSAIAETRLGHLPQGLARVPTTGELLVTLSGSDRLLRISADGSSIAGAIGLARAPRALAVSHDGSRAFVSHFISDGDTGTLSVVDLASFTRTAEVALAEDPGPDTATSGRGIPNLLSAIAIEPSGRMVWVGGLKSNTNRGTFISGEPFTFANRVRSVLLPVSTDALADRIDRRIDANDADSISAVAFDGRGRHAYVAHAGAGRVSVYDMSLARLFERGTDGDTIPFEARVDVGDTPRGLLLTSDDARLYVWNELSRDVTVLDVTSPAAPSEIATIVLTGEPLAPEIALGKRLFNRSLEPVHSRDNYIACASCHPDGGLDGRTWDLTQFGEGLRNTIDLRGRGGLADGPLHWSANFDEVQDFENDIVNSFGGEGLAVDGMPPFHPLDGPPNGGRSADLDALAAYVSSLAEAPPSPHRESDGSLVEAARRGRAIFMDAAVGCATCHAPPRFTDSALGIAAADFVRHDVGTLRPGSGGRLGGALDGLDTPSLVGVWTTAPYLHDGRARTLREVLREENPDDRHGVTSGLDDSAVDDLVAYLLSLDGRPEEPTAVGDAGVASDGSAPDVGSVRDASHGGCECHASAGPRPPPLLAVLVLNLALSLTCFRARRRSGLQPQRASAIVRAARDDRTSDLDAV
jgi:DNA-binding beta-propeller fold protein YncE/mono/diheme cytochrome c family protein